MKHQYKLTITLPDDAEFSSGDVADELYRAFDDQVRPSIRNYLTNATVHFELVPMPTPDSSIP